MKYKFDNLFLIVLHGPMGVGKTAVADVLHGEIENMAHFGVDHIKWLISDGKTNPERKRVSEHMVKIMTNEYLKLGTSVLVEQAFTKREIDDLRNIAKENKVRFLIYKLEADKETAQKRVMERTRTLRKPVIPINHIEVSFNNYNENKSTDGTLINTEEMTMREIADQILNDLNS